MFPDGPALLKTCGAVHVPLGDGMVFALDAVMLGCRMVRGMKGFFLMATNLTDQVSLACSRVSPCASHSGSLTQRSALSSSLRYGKELHTCASGSKAGLCKQSHGGGACPAGSFYTRWYDTSL